MGPGGRAPWPPEALTIDPLTIDPGAQLLPPGPHHWLGTDELGRDVLARLLAGTAVTLAVAVPATLLALALGFGYGLATGLAPRPLAAFLARLLDALLAIPVLIALMAAASLVSDLQAPMLALLIGVTGWPPLARLVRQEVAALRPRAFMLAADQLGAGPWHQARHHILPALAPLLATNAAFLTGDAILLLSTLSFLGLGIQPPRPSWGGMLAAGFTYADAGAWWLILPPALLIVGSLLLAGAMATRCLPSKA